MKGKFISKLSAGKKLFAPGVQKPVYLINFVTNSCNAACDHCFYWKELNTKKTIELSVKEHAEIAKALGGMLQITFTGGSPELRSDLPEIVYEYYKFCKPGNMTICMLGSNTKLIIEHTEKILKTCVGQHLTIGISLDGLGVEHDRYRKLNGLFDRVVTTLNELHLLQKSHSNLRIAIGMVVHGLNVEKVENTASWIRNNLSIDILKPILVRGNPINPATRNDECIEIYERIVDNDHKWLIDNTITKTSFIDKVIRAKEDVQRTVIKEISSSKASVITCSGARETAVMYPSGNIAGCEMRTNILGNIRDFNYNFRNVWFSNEANEFRGNVGKVKECKGCYHHCFISPAIFRTPAMWRKILKSILEINKQNRRPTQ